MKLLVIVICLLSERFLVHASSHNRFHWFGLYVNHLIKKLPNILSSAWILLSIILVPLLLAVGIFIYLFGNILFGFIGLLLNIAIFHYCIGPNNPFYPSRTESLEDTASTKDVGDYLAVVNGQLFAVIFWYIILGPVGALAYRLISLSQQQAPIAKPAVFLTGVLDWIPAKITTLLYLLVGNFQAGFRHFSSLFFTTPDNNHMMLSLCGLQALSSNEQEQALMPRAETLVEHALIGFLVLLAIFTMVAWL